jgi:hypothetical protein
MFSLDIISTVSYFNTYMQANQQLNRPGIIQRISSNQRIIAGVICAAIVSGCVYVWLAAHDKIDISFWLLYCGFRQRFDLPCQTCGMTTAVFSFARGRILQAFYIQPAAALFCCLLIISTILAFIMSVFGLSFRFVERFFAEVRLRYIILAVVIILAVGWAVTLARAIEGNY